MWILTERSKRTQEAAVHCFNEELDRSVRYEDIKEFQLDRAYGLNRKEGRRLWRKLEARIYALGVPMENAASVLRDLKEKGHDIYFITARPGLPEITQVTKDWLRKYKFPYDGENLFIGSQDKAKVAQKLGVELFFEDAPQHLDRLVAAGIPTVVMDAAYNETMGGLPRLAELGRSRTVDSADGGAKPETMAMDCWSNLL